MSENISSLLYIVSGVLFIMALRGLSHPTTSRQGNLYGMVGMGLAILTTLVGHPPAGFGAWILVLLGLGIGGGAGAVIAKRVLDDRDAAARRGVPLAGRPRGGVRGGAAPSTRRRPSASSRTATIHKQSLFEMGLGVAIGAITFTGSVIAFAEARRAACAASRSCCRAPPDQSRCWLAVLVLLIAPVHRHRVTRPLFWLIVDRLRWCSAS